MSQPVEANYTKVRCTNCGEEYEGIGDDGKAVGKLPPCAKCGLTTYKRLVVNPVCDFCSTAFETGAICWTYPADVFIFPFQSADGSTEWNSGPWSACKECHELVEAGDLKALSEHAVDKEIAMDPSIAPVRAQLLTMIAALHLTFAENRMGDPFRERFREDGEWETLD